MAYDLAVVCVVVAVLRCSGVDRFRFHISCAYPQRRRRRVESFDLARSRRSRLSGHRVEDDPHIVRGYILVYPSFSSVRVRDSASSKAVARYCRGRDNDAVLDELCRSRVRVEAASSS